MSKNLTNIKEIVSPMTKGQTKALTGIALGIIKFERINKDDMPLLLKCLYHSMMHREYLTMVEHDTIAVIRKMLHESENLEFTPWAYRQEEKN